MNGFNLDELSPDEVRQISYDAERLRTDAAFQRAYKYLHQKAIAQLSTCDPTDEAAIRDAQAYMRVSSDFGMILAASALMSRTLPDMGELADNPAHGTA